ncbi:MAG: galactose oxidase-like domain-containing protein [Gemmatimonadales bacterium]
MTPLKQLHPWALIGLLALGTLQCGGDTVAPPTPSAIAGAAGDAQTGLVGQTLAQPLVVLVSDASGGPVAGVSVQWDVQGGGSVSAASVTTGSDGKAAVQRVLGSVPGQVTTTASVSGLQGSPVTFVSTAADASTPMLLLRTQPSSTAQSGVEFAVQPVVQLQNPDGSDRAESGLAVTASLASGSGTLGGTLTRASGPDGSTAFTDLKLTGPAGAYTLRFTAAGTVPVVSATITIGGTSGSAVLLTGNPPVAALSGEVFAPEVQPVVEVRDANGDPAAGVAVTVSATPASGTLEGGTVATTDGAGVARFGDLGIRGPGSYTLTFAAGSGSVTSAPIAVSALPSEATTGKWGPLVPWDIVPLHMHLLPNKKVLAWGKYEDGTSMTSMMATAPRLWTPSQGAPTSATVVRADTMLFCSGHAFMPDGRLMVSGGHKQDDVGIDVTNIFDPQSESWQPGLPKMAHGRWYPTVTTLPDGRMLTMAGRDSAGRVVTTPEVWANGAWAELRGAGTLEIPYYPRNFVAPNGLVFMAGERIQARWFDPDATSAGGQGKWTTSPGLAHRWPFNRDYGTAVMYEPGKIMYAGGGGNRTWGQSPDAKDNQPTATAEKIDLTAASPVWSSAGSMAIPRRHLNSTILPDGTVLITGGTRGGGFVDINPGNAAREAELWDPATDQWTTLAANSVMRVYHSVSLLLPDGTVLHGASGNAFAGAVPVPDQQNHEIFSPPYLFKGARPTITSAPASVGYGQTFAVATPNAAQITGVRWIHLGSVTHAFDAGQRANTLGFTRTATGVSVTAPANANLAPPGPYMIFVLNRNGVPSAGKVVMVQ